MTTNVLITVACLLLAVVPRESVVRDAVDVIEVNHLFDDGGRPVFTQVIFWHWCLSSSRYHVRAWRLVKDQSQLPRRDHFSGGYVAWWQDGETLRAVHAQSVRETWTQYDPELLERDVLPVEHRSQLRR